MNTYESLQRVFPVPFDKWIRVFSTMNITIHSLTSEKISIFLREMELLFQEKNKRPEHIVVKLTDLFFEKRNPSLKQKEVSKEELSVFLNSLVK